jgi:hypothetical protein
MKFIPKLRIRRKFKERKGERESDRLKKIVRNKGKGEFLFERKLMQNL